MRAITDGEWARMSWRARQDYLAAQTELRRRYDDAIRSGRTTLARRRAGYGYDTRTPEQITRTAQAVLDRLGPDPDHEQHLADLVAAITEKEHT
jgi:hypothetical protein